MLDPMYHQISEEERSKPMPLEFFSGLSPELELAPSEAQACWQAGIRNPYAVAVLAPLRSNMRGIREVINLYEVHEANLDRLVADLPGGLANALSALTRQVNFTSEHHRRSTKRIPEPQPLSPLAGDHTDWITEHTTGAAYEVNGSSVSTLIGKLEEGLRVSHTETGASYHLFMQTIGLPL